MIARAKSWAKRHWPRLSLRTYLFASFFLVAALPGVGAVFLRVYENTLVRQTEAELVAQGAVLVAAAATLWPAAPAGRTVQPPAPTGADPYRMPDTTEIDLSATSILPERQAPSPAAPPLTDAALAAVRLGQIFADTRAATLASLILLDRDGRIVDGTAAVGSYAKLPEVAAALHGEPRTVLRRNGAYRSVHRFDWLSRAAATRVHYARPILVDGRVVGVVLLSRSSRTLFSGLYTDWGKIALGVLAILAALIMLSGLLSRGIARPIEALRQAAGGVAAGRGSMPAVPVTAAIEIQDLYRDFAAMAAAIERRSRYLRDFAHAVSHEFKTPLAGIRGAIELLEDHSDTMSPADRRRFLANADADAGRLTLLVSRLLDLARADMFEHESSVTCDAVEVTGGIADAFCRDEFVVSVSAAERQIPVIMDATTMETVLTTMLENSRQAGADQVAIDIRSGTSVGITVSDNGSGIAAADRARVFEPFFTSRRASGGTGLGLPIARSLVAASSGDVRLAATMSGTSFLITLPGAPPHQRMAGDRERDQAIE